MGEERDAGSRDNRRRTIQKELVVTILITIVIVCILVFVRLWVKS